MSGFAIYRIGRSAEADIRVDDTSVSRVHAELIMTPGGRCYLTDCASSGGTFRVENGEWAPLKQDFVELNEALLLGRYQTNAKQLLALAAQGQGIKAATGDGRHPSPGLGQGVALLDDDMPHGPVQRDEETGDIISTGED